MKHLQLGIVTDEIANDFSEAMLYASQWGISLFELRLLASGRVPDVKHDEIDAVQSYCAKNNCRVTALSPGIFKHSLSRTQELEKELIDTLPRTIALANTLKAPLIIVFGFKREQGEPESNRNKAVGLFRRAAALVEKAGMRMAVENEPGFWCDTGANTRQIIDEVDSPAFGANWDPCNAYGTDEVPYPDGYRAIKERIFNVHVKDTKRGSLIECVPVGDGVIDWEGQIRALINDKIVSHVTIETHCHPLIESSRRNAETLKRMIASESKE